jgi:ribosomal protein S10
MSLRLNSDDFEEKAIQAVMHKIKNGADKSVDPIAGPCPLEQWPSDINISN